VGTGGEDRPRVRVPAVSNKRVEASVNSPASFRVSARRLTLVVRRNMLKVCFIL
jgi:hypothetical protein